MLCIANTRHIVLQSCSLVHNTTSSGYFGCAIRIPFLRANFFQTRFKLWNSVLKVLIFQNIEKLISLHMHFNTLFQ